MKKFNTKILTVILVVLVIILVSKNRHENKAKFEQLANATFEMSFAHETLVNNCATEKDNKELILKDVENLRAALGNLVKTEYSAGKLISQETFCKMLAFNVESDKLQILGHKACFSENLLSSERNNRYKRDLLTAIEKDSLIDSKAFTSVANLFSDKSLQKHIRTVCHLD